MNSYATTLSVMLLIALAGCTSGPESLRGLTSIINPAHKIVTRYPRELTEKDGVSKMPNYNDLLTVTDLIDIVTFLEPRYTLQPYSPTGYHSFLAVAGLPAGYRVSLLRISLP